MNPRPVFSLGQIVATRGAIALLDSSGTKPAALLDRHLGGDWGDLDDEDKRLNDHAAAMGGLRIFSAYQLTTGRIWVITEADRSVTTLLLPDEY